MTDKLSSAEPNEGSTAQRGCCAGVDHSLSDRDLEVDVETLAAVGSETRYGALRLVAASEGGTCGCELEPALGVSQGAVSQALSRLYDAGLLTRRKEGRWRYYDATGRAERLLALLDETRSAGETGSADERRSTDEIEAGSQS
ncbi:ArsR/SmtB family transcription factor [Halorubrum lacusprofundi]|jgi:ArsR family transcriptional regulator|uniref:Transcriptional regulator, ArsR family n=1 Tax=Halorubrum lacusprofundi (strain ATCC 49239 / DSM 5036 / JCM 8891 / ACAM 34) TaxID=416348 RepID=B9LN99_HALLT|nr:metalloregulator ArsR/SmtB family transcription factor [Halorubrum lacusprofundi]ACM56837.1 transcriptional regulator, ArsR family [Halorubrum lacusprofundi ATCC 49239]MCG1006472.1 metalloregulator ArsR/SmtB family transcription factor [Halorubrum lacusprofundi]